MYLANNIKGFGFKPTCETGTFEFDFHNYTTQANITTVFNSSIYYGVGTTEAENSPITLNVTYASDGIAAAVDASSIKTWHNCTLVKAIVEYPVIITGNNITLQTNKNFSYLPNDVQYVFRLQDSADSNCNLNYRDIPGHQTEQTPWGEVVSEVTVYSTIVGGFGFYLESLFNSTSVLSYFDNGETAPTFNLDSSGLYASQYMNLGSDDWGIQAMTNWTDPIQDMLNTTNQLTFRTAVQVAQQTPSSAFAQNVVYTGTKITTVYKSNYALMGVAVAINFLGLLSILPVYYGWWELGRNTSLSPLETAKAFGAPLLRDVDGNATATQILKKVGDRRVKYGETFGSGREGEGFLIPRKGLRGRLQIVEEARARSPEVGDVFGPKR